MHMKTPHPTARMLIGRPSFPSEKKPFSFASFGGHSPRSRLNSIGTVTSR
jgi:hypothetical protein